MNKNELDLKKRSLLIFLICQFVVFSFSTYLFIQSPGIVSKRLILISCIVSFVLCMITAWITNITKYRFFIFLKKYPSQIIKFLVLMFIVLLISFDLPSLYFLGPTVDLTVTLFSNIEKSGSTTISALNNGLIYIPKNQIELFRNASRTGENLVFNYSQNQSAGFRWQGKGWKTLSIEFKDTTTPTYIAIKINDNNEVADIPVSEINQMEHVYIDVPNQSHFENISKIIAAFFLAFSTFFLLSLILPLLEKITPGLWVSKPSAYRKKNRKEKNETRDYLNTLKTEKIGILNLKDLAFIILLVLVIGVNFIPLFRNQYPIGFAGLYSFMSDLLKQNNFIPPVSVPYYGPGGIPYAYPFLGFYISGFISKLIGITQWQYVRIFPVLFYALALIFLYLIAHELIKSKLLALGALIISASDSLLFYTNATSGGMVRGLALFLALTAIYVYLYSTHNRKEMIFFICSGVLLGLTFMTHLVYGILAACFICTFILFRGSTLKVRIERILILSILAILVSTPWWLMIVQRYGFSPFFNSFGTHDFQGFFKTVPQGRFDLFFENLVSQLSIRTPFFSLILKSSMAYLFLFSWSPLVFAWLIIATLLGEVSWISGLLSGVIIISFCISLFQFIRTKKLLQVVYFAIFIFILITFVQFGINLPQLESEITPDYLSIAEYLLSRPENKSDIHQYLLVDKSHARGEWLPYLAQANPIFGPWGAEWTGNYVSENKIRQQLVNCLSSSTSLECFKLFDDEVCDSKCGLYIIENQYPQIIAYTKDEHGLIILYTNDWYSVLSQQ